MKVIKPPINYNPNEKTIFLAGSIEMGTAEDWQKYVERQLSNISELVVFNPRRDDWDSSWEQTIENQQFAEQVRWEMRHLRRADIIFMYLSPNTISPISLLELGWHHDAEIIVCCPEGYFRRGNVEIFCDYHHIPLHSDLDDAIQALTDMVDHI